MSEFYLSHIVKGTPLDTLQVIVLAMLQGLTEFLPISSSAHLILPSQLLGWTDQGLAFDVAVHVGSLLAVMLYFRKQVFEMVMGCLLSLKEKALNHDSRLAIAVGVGVIPASLAGVTMGGLIEQYLRSSWVIATTTIVFGVLLWMADRRKDHTKTEQQIGIKEGLMIGMAQALALIPGTSRSGITITAALFMGFNRDAAARFSFLMSIPAILGAGSMQTVKLVEQAGPVDWGAIGLGTVISFVSAYACIHWFLILLDKIGMTPFVIYRLILGVFLFSFLTLG